MTTQPRAIMRIDELSDRLGRLDPQLAQPWSRDIQAGLSAVKAEAQQRTARAEVIWPEVHSLEERVNERDDDLAHLSTSVDHHLRNQPDAAREAESKDFRDLKAAADQEDPAGAKHQEALERARSLIAGSHERSRIKFDSARKTQRGLWALSGLLVLGGVMAGWAQAQVGFAFVTQPTGTEALGVSNTWFLSILLFAGALGGALSALYSLYLTKEVEDTSWNDPRPSLVITKVAVGSWSSVLAALAVGTGALVGAFDSLSAAILIGIAFGYAQQAVTGILDKQTLGLVPK